MPTAMGMSSAAHALRRASGALRVPGGATAGAARRAFSSLPAQQPTLMTTLPNQLRVASESSGGETATLGMWIDTGSRYETDANNGVAHFLEHMAFKGTAKRTQHQLEVEVENMGGHLNAYTSREQTVYYAKVLKKDVPKAVELLSDILTNSTFSAGAVERERDVIMREMEEVQSITEEVIFDMLHECAFVGTPLARTILGPKENIASISVDDIKNYIATHYTGPRMVFAASGAVEHNQLVDLCGEHFGGVATEAPAGYTYEREPSLFSGADVRDYNDDMELGHFALAFEGTTGHARGRCPAAGWRMAAPSPLPMVAPTARTRAQELGTLCTLCPNPPPPLPLPSFLYTAHTPPLHAHSLPRLLLALAPSADGNGAQSSHAKGEGGRGGAGGEREEGEEGQCGLLCRPV